MAVERCPRDILDIRLDSLRERCCRLFQENEEGNVPLAIEPRFARAAREPRPWCKNAGEVQRIRAGDRDKTIVRRAPPERTQRRHSLGQRELLT